MGYLDDFSAAFPTQSGSDQPKGGGANGGLDPAWVAAHPGSGNGIFSGIHDFISNPQNWGTAIGAYFGGAIGLGAPGALAGGKAGSDYTSALTQKPPSPIAPPAPPTLGQTNLATLGGRLDYEQMQHSASTILTGGQGLTDEPTTASSVLLGS